MVGHESDPLLLPADPEKNGDDHVEGGANDDDGIEASASTSMFARCMQEKRCGGGRDNGLSSSLRPTKEDFMEEYNEIKAAFKDHLLETEDEEDFFLSMGLAKTMSMLPSKSEVVQTLEEVEDVFGAKSLIPESLRDVDDLLETAAAAASKGEQPPAQGKDDGTSTSSRVPLRAYITLGTAVCALSSIGPFLAKQRDVAGTLKIVWRFQGTALLLCPLLVRSFVIDGFPKLSYVQWITFLFTAASYSVLCVAFAKAIDYTTVANATILTNSQSVLLVMAKILIPTQRVLFLEVFGVLVAFLGGILAAKEAAEDEDSPATGWLSIWGDALGLISSIGGIG